MSPRLRTGAHILMDLLLDLTDIILTVVGEVLFDSEVPAVTSSILKIYRLSFSEALIGIELCACIVGVSMHVYM